MARRKLTEATRHSGGVAAAARWQGCAKQLEKSSSPRREIGGEGNRITGDTGKSVEDERDSEGLIFSEEAVAQALNREFCVQKPVICPKT